MHVSFNPNNQCISYKSKLPNRKIPVKLNENTKMKGVTWQYLRKNAKKNLPVVLGTVGLFLPVPFASVAGFAIGTIITKIQKLLK